MGDTVATRWRHDGDTMIDTMAPRREVFARWSCRGVSWLQGDGNCAWQVPHMSSAEYSSRTLSDISQSHGSKHHTLHARYMGEIERYLLIIAWYRCD
jgi:hypothetical protein